MFCAAASGFSFSSSSSFRWPRLCIRCTQETLYKASASVILSRQDPGYEPLGAARCRLAEDPKRFIDTQVTIARSLELAREVIAATNLSQTPFEFRQHSSVSTTQDADVMDFSFTAPTADQASRIATAYATRFTAYRHRLDTEALDRARADLGEQITRLRSQGREGSPLLDSLLEKDQQLQILAALTISNAKVVHAAGEPEQVQPRPVRNAMLALLLGILLGVALAFLREAVDNRIRSAEEIGHQLGMPLIARLPGPPRRLRRDRVTGRARRAEQPGRGAVPDAANEPRIRDNRRRHPLDHDHERGGTGRQVDDGGQPGGHARAAGAARPARRPGPSSPVPAQVLPPRDPARSDRRRAGPGDRRGRRPSHRCCSEPGADVQVPTRRAATATATCTVSSRY